MTPTVKKKTIHYKRAEINKKGFTLQAFLQKALHQTKKPTDRIETLNIEGSNRRFINSFRAQNGMIFGQMLVYEANKDQTIVILDESSDEYPIEALKIPPRPDGKPQEFLESILYFGILENHIVLMQTQLLKARDLESHFMWLFRERTSVVPEDIVICLSDKPTHEARKKIEKMPVRKVVIGAPLEAEERQTERREVAVTQARKMSFSPKGRGFNILEAALGTDWRKGLKLEDSLDEANLRVNLEVTYFRKTTKAAHDILDNIATAMRHIEPEDVKVHLEGGGILKGVDLKLTGNIHVKTHNGRILDSGEVYLEMFEWLKARIEEGSIT